MQTFNDFIKEGGVDYFIVQLPEEMIDKNALINEGRWVSSMKSG